MNRNSGNKYESYKEKESSTGSSAEWIENLEERFINPYNFIPLEGSVARFPYKINYKDTHTGYFDCRLDVLTPLIIPNTSCDKALHILKELEGEKRKEENGKGTSWDFFSYQVLKENDGGIYKPIIPGSEIRGAVRSVYEAAFQCCMSAVSGDRTLGRRWPGPGILEKKEGDEWSLTPCIKYTLADKGELLLLEGQMIRGYVDKSSKKEVFIPRENEQDVTQDALDCDGSLKTVEGYFHLGEKFTKFASRSVFVKNEKEKSRNVSTADMDALKKVLEEYKDKKKNRRLQEHEHTGYVHYDLDKLVHSDKSVLPVYYIASEEHLYLSPACIGKELFNKTIQDLLENNGGFHPCTGTDGVCSGCAVFGMVSGEKGKGNAIGSRIRFTDGIVEEEPVDGDYKKYYKNPILLPELGEPKPGTVEFYTYAPYKEASACGWRNSEGYWTYDYKCERKRSKIESGKIKPGKIKPSITIERVVLNADQPRLRGRKYYWHSDEWSKYGSNGPLTSMRQRVRPLDSRSDVHFKFRVYFENLTNEELERVKWALDFHDPQCAHKIGRAKPLGFGSVRITVKELYFRNINPEDGSWDMTAQDLSSFQETNIAENTKAIRTLKLMANWEKRPGKLDDMNNVSICYPLGEDLSRNPSSGKKNLAASHQWFNGNRTRSSDSKKMQPAFSKVLPQAEEEVDELQKDKWLYKLEKIKKSN